MSCVWRAVPQVLLGLCLVAGPIRGAELRIPEAEAKKAAIEKPPPAYPLAARQLKVVGKVEVEATVDGEGSVQEVKILTGNPLLTKAAVEAVKKWKFKPFDSAAVVSLSFEFR